ncbi:LptF/LptG family permease [Pelagibacterales bacterium SAG-MED22]|nr:LptF/LptG family permease [Pelagibacterales bacterium SAG-MED22]
MKTYIRFLTISFLKSFINIFLIMLSLVLILNLLSELDFFKDLEVGNLFPIYLALLNSGSLIFEMFPFIFLLCTQFFFISLFKDNQLSVFKYSGLKNSSIIKILSFLTFFIGIFVVIFFYNLTSNFKNFYLELKSNYTSDDKYLAVITNNGLWIKDKIDNRTLIINSTKIKPDYLVDAFISEFDSDFNIIRNIKSEEVNIKSNEWIINDAEIFANNISTANKNIKIKSNFNYERIQGLFSNLSSLSVLELLKLKENYKLLGYSTVEVEVHLNRLISYPFYLLLMTIFSSIIMFNSKNLKNTGIKIAIGLFFSVIIYYINNFFYVLGNTERVSIYLSVWFPLFILTTVNFILMRTINEK